MRSSLIIILIFGSAGWSQAAEPASVTGSDFRQAAQALIDRDQLTGDWFDARAALADEGITISPSLLLDFTMNARGGADTEGTSTRYLIDVPVEFDLSALVGLDGATFFLDYQHQRGDDASENLTGAIQGTSNADADGRSQLAEIWYQQVLFADKFRVKVGKIDANSEFAYADFAGEVVHGVHSCPATILDFPTYPDPAMGAVVFVHPCEQFYAGAGIWDGALHTGVTTGENSPETLFGDPDDLFLIGELGVTWQFEGDLEGRFAVGGWGHTGEFIRFDGGRDNGAAGFYAMLDQRLWREAPYSEGDEQGLGCFAQFGWTDESVSEVTVNIAGGLQWTGPVPTRDDDICGLAVTYARLSDEPGAGFVDDHETNIELFYKFQITPYFSVKPDVQYIINPGGAGADDAVAMTLRVEVAF